MDRVLTASSRSRKPSPAPSHPTSRDKTPPLARLDLARATKGGVYIPKPLLPHRPYGSDRSARLSIASHRSRVNDSSNRLSDSTTEPLMFPEMAPQTDRPGRASVDMSRDHQVREGNGRGKTKAVVKKESAMFARDKLFQATVGRENHPVTSTRNLGYRNRTGEKVEVTGKTLEALRMMAREVEDLIRIFEEDSEGNQPAIFDKLYSLFVWSQKAEPYPIGFKALELYFTITNLYKDFNKTIHLIKLYKSIATIYNDYTRKLDSYKWLALVYQDHQRVELALMYLKKMLRLAWAIGDKDRELLAYDLLGMQFYYRGELETANYFHQRMVNGEWEPDTSAHYQIAQNYFKMSLAQRSFEDTLHKEEAHKVYVSSGEEDIDLPAKKEINTKSKYPSLMGNPLKLKANEEKHQCRQALKAINERSQSHGRIPLHTGLNPVDENTPKIINVEDFARSLVTKRKQTVGSGKISHSVRINHMSTNRIAENLHHLQQSAGSYKEDAGNGRYLDGYARAKISSLLCKFQANIEKYAVTVRNVIESR